MQDALNDMWVFNVTDLSFTQTVYQNGSVPTMCRFGNAYDATSDKLYVWGGEYGFGMDAYDISRSMFVFDHRMLSWRQIQYAIAVTVLQWPCMWVSGSVVYRYGGRDDIKQLTSTSMFSTVCTS